MHHTYQGNIVTKTSAFPNFSLGTRGCIFFALLGFLSIRAFPQAGSLPSYQVPNPPIKIPKLLLPNNTPKPLEQVAPKATASDIGEQFKRYALSYWTSLQAQDSRFQPIEDAGGLDWNQSLAKATKELAATDLATLSIPEIAKMAADSKALALLLRRPQINQRKFVLPKMAGPAPQAKPPNILQKKRAVRHSETHSISSVNGDGAVLIMEDGSVWEVEATDRIYSALWLPVDDVVIVDDGKIVNIDEGESVDAQKIK